MVKSDGPKLSLSEAVSQAAKSAGVTPISAPNALQGDLEKPELKKRTVNRYLVGKYIFILCLEITYANIHAQVPITRYLFTMHVRIVKHCFESRQQTGCRMFIHPLHHFNFYFDNFSTSLNSNVTLMSN